MHMMQVWEPSVRKDVVLPSNRKNLLSFFNIAIQNVVAKLDSPEILSYSKDSLTVVRPQLNLGVLGVLYPTDHNDAG